MIDAVLSYHTKTSACGVAKFSHALAQKLGVPFDCTSRALRYRRPLLSIKTSEWEDWFDIDINSYELFFHDAPEVRSFSERIDTIRRAWRVFAGNTVVADALRPYRPDVIEAFCPSTLTGNPHRGAYRVLVFGMAHKLLLPKFEELKRVLDAEHPDYTVELSTAVHEGSPWDVALTESVEAMRGIFGDKLRVLGFLGDDALAKELQDCDAVAAFYQPALRANNTSAWAALEAGKPLYTNTDAYSPQKDSRVHSWDRLLEILRA